MNISRQKYISLDVLDLQYIFQLHTNTSNKYIPSTSWKQIQQKSCKQKKLNYAEKQFYFLNFHGGL